MTQRLQRILFAEDEPDIMKVALVALEGLGSFHVKACLSGREAVDSAAQFNPDLLLLDVMMPGMDGPSALNAIRALPGMADTPAIFMTARVQQQEIEEYKNLGVIDVIPKPFDPMTLADRIKEIWQQRVA